MGFVFETFALDMAALAACVFAAIYIYFLKSYTYWQKRNVPYVKPNFPFGNFGDLVFRRKFIGHLYVKFYKILDGENYGGIYAFKTPAFIIRDPDIIKNILVKDFPSFHDRALPFDEEIEPLLSNLLTLTGNKWRNLRVKLTPTFTSGKMKMMFHTMVDCALELGSILEQSADNEENLEMKDISARYNTDVISSCAFGVQGNCLKNPDAEFRQWGRKLITPSIRSSIAGVILQTFPSLLSVLKLAPFDPKITKYFRNMVEDTVSYRERHNIKRNDFMQLLIQIKNKGKLDEERESPQQNDHGNLQNKHNEDGLSMNSLAAQAFLFYLGGFETTSTAMMFCLYELSLNQDIQQRLQEEIDVVLKKHEGNITYEAIQEMEYLDKVVSETLRKYPSVVFLNRLCTKDYNIPGTDVVLEKGIMTFIPVLALHNDPKYYPEPERFDPERFSEDEKAKRHHYVYLPFGEGPRNCIGMRFGLMQTKVGLVSLLSKYQFGVIKKTPIPLVFDKRSLFLSPGVEMWLQIKRRVM